MAETYQDFIADEHSGDYIDEMEDADQQQAQHRALVDALDKLPAREKEVIYRYFFEGAELLAMSRERGYSDPWACNAKSKGLERLRDDHALQAVWRDA